MRRVSAPCSQKFLYTYYILIYIVAEGRQAENEEQQYARRPPATGYIITILLFGFEFSSLPQVPWQNLQPEPLLNRPFLRVNHLLAPCQLCDYQFFPKTLAISFCQAPHLGRNCLLWHSVLGGSSFQYASS